MSSFEDNDEGVFDTASEKAKRDAAREKHKSEAITVAADFLVQVTGVKRDVNKNGKPFMLLTLRCVYGPLKGRKVQERVFLTPESSGFLLAAAECFSVAGSFKKIEQDLRRVFGRKIGKVRTSVEQNGEYKNVRVKFLSRLEKAEVEIVEQMIAEQAIDDSVNGRLEDDEPVRGAGDGAPPHNDDDNIPF